MPRRLRRILVPLSALRVALAVAPGAWAACAGEDVSPSDPAAVAATLCLLNEQRAQHGLGALAESPVLDKAAHSYAAKMVAQRFFDHVSPDGSTLSTRARAAGYRGPTLGETIGWGEGELATPAAIVQAWMASPPHHAILMSRAFRKIGLGVAIGSPEGAGAAATVTADFGG